IWLVSYRWASPGPRVACCAQVSHPEACEDRGSCDRAAGLRRIRQRDAKRVAEDLTEEGALAAAVRGDHVVDAYAVLFDDLLAVHEAERDALEQRAPEMAAPVMEAESDVSTARVGVPDRRALALQVGEEEETVTPTRHLLSFRVEHVERRKGAAALFGR